MTAARSVPSSLATLLAELELERPAVVTLPWLENARLRLGLSRSAADLARRLRGRGWLLPLRVRGAWEFAPADRAGPLPGGDPFIELRALRAVRPEIRVGVGYESAAFLRSLVSRQPSREVIICAEGTPLLRSLDEFRRVDLTLPEAAYSDLDGLPVLTPAGLLAAIATRPGGFRDWPGLAEWLADVASSADASELEQLIDGRPTAAFARAAYLLRAGGNPEIAEELLQRAPAGRGPFYLGPRRGGGHYDQVTDVVDTVIARYAQAGQGS